MKLLGSSNVRFWEVQMYEDLILERREVVSTIKTCMLATRLTLPSFQGSPHYATDKLYLINFIMGSIQPKKIYLTNNVVFCCQVLLKLLDLPVSLLNFRHQETRIG